MIQTNAVKSTARATLKGKWLWACAVSLIPLFSFSVVFLIESILNVVFGKLAIVFGVLLNLFLTFPLILGVLRVYWFFINSADESIVKVFHYFSDFVKYKRAMAFVLRVFLPILLTGIVLFLPSIFLGWVASGRFFEFFNLSIPLFIGGLRNIAIVLAIASGVILIVKALNIFIAAFLFVSDDEMPSKKCISLALEVSKKTKSMYVSHIFGFSFYIIISIFALPLIFTAPFLLISYLIDCRFCVAYYNRLGSMKNSAPVYSC